MATPSNVPAFGRQYLLTGAANVFGAVQVQRQMPGCPLTSTTLAEGAAGGVQAVQEVMPDGPQVAVDSPASLQPIQAPKKFLREKFRIRVHVAVPVAQKPPGQARVKVVARV